MRLFFLLRCSSLLAFAWEALMPSDAPVTAPKATRTDRTMVARVKQFDDSVRRIVRLKCQMPTRTPGRWHAPTTNGPVANNLDTVRVLEGGRAAVGPTETGCETRFYESRKHTTYDSGFEIPGNLVLLYQDPCRLDKTVRWESPPGSIRLQDAGRAPGMSIRGAPTPLAAIKRALFWR